MLSFIVGESELARRIRAHPWAETELGPPDTWPDSLKTLVSVMLAANQQMYTVWGPNQLLLYNDRYIEVLQSHHPTALGRPFLEVWREIADDLRPLVENAYAGIPTYQDDITLMLERDGRTVEAHFTYSFTPVFNDAGGVDGFICHCIETTEQVKAARVIRESEERQAFLLKLSDALRPLADPIDIEETASRVLGEYLDVDRIAYGTIENDDVATITRDYRRPGFASVAGTYRPHDFDPMVADVLCAGKTIAVSRIATDPVMNEQARSNYAHYGIGALVAVGLRKGGRWVAALLVHSGPRAWTASEITVIEQVADRTWAAIERARVEAALLASEARFQQFAAASASALWIRDAATLTMEYVSPAIAGIYGAAPETFLTGIEHWAASIVPDDRDVALAHIDKARRGEAVVHEFRIQRASDRAFRWIRDTSFPLYGEDGGIQRIGGIAEDVTQAKLAGEHTGVLLAELQHRVRNIMAMTRSIVARTGERSESVADYTTLILGRLLAMARVQALLTRAANVSVGIRSLVHDEVSVQAQHEGQYVLDGPEIALSPKAAEVLTLAIHELATNALKYGALSVQDGTVTVRWATFEQRGRTWLGLDWSEAGAPIQVASPDRPRRRGFGTELIEGRIPYELKGKGTVAIAPEGARCRLEFPLTGGASILETGAPQQATVFGGALDMTGEADLSDRRVLVVEDDYYLATDSARALRGAGAEVMGPCASEEDARAALNDLRPDAVVLDINLGTGATFKLAEHLKDNGIPFVFVTGYDPDVIPAEFDGVERLEKPVQLRQVVGAVARLVTPQT